jgi:Uma2 family endonuclease
MRVRSTESTKSVRNDKGFFLPGGVHVAAAPGKYRVVPPPDLNNLKDERFLLEYEFPILTVEDRAKRIPASAQTIEAYGQACDWQRRNATAGGFIGVSVSGYRSGYQFNGPSPGHDQQLVPDLSYIDQETWKCLPKKDAKYLSCVPAVVFYFLSPTNTLEELQRKVSWFIAAGTREGVVVDALHDRVWIYNRGKDPHFDFMSELLIDSMPGFTLDCSAVRSVLDLFGQQPG